METQCVRIPLRPEKTGRFLAWLAEARDRKAEMLNSMKAEGVVFEAFFLERGIDSDSVLFYMRARSLADAQAAFGRSTLSIDREARAMMEECWDVDSANALEVLLELEP